jgi:ankyrin repeat protein
VNLALLLSIAAVLFQTDADGLTPLMRAAARGDAAQVRSLVEGGADVNLAHAELRITPLMFAAYSGHDAVVQLLLEKGARANAKDAAGASAADWASQGGHEPTADRLGKAGAQLNPFLNVGILPFGLMDKAAGKTPA